MIERIEIASCGSYGTVHERMPDLRQVNYIYGSNGAGKTTVSRLIADEASSSASFVRWQAGTKLESLVYNRDFVAVNFNASPTLKGIFTLGEKDTTILAKIDAAQAEILRLTGVIERLSANLHGEDGNGGKLAELTKIEEEFRDACWTAKKTHEATLQGAMTGYRNSAEKFKDKILAERLTNKSAVLTLPELHSKAATVFGQEPAVESELALFDQGKLLSWEKSEFLKRRVLGKEDVDIAAMIHKLENSDWVKQGVAFYVQNASYCPFCQQMTPATLSESLTEYFDESFVRDTTAIKEAEEGYKLDGERLSLALQAYLDAKPRFLETDKLKTERDLFESRFKMNLQLLASKRKEPSQIVELEPLDDVLTRAKSLIEEANQKTASHNATVANLANEKRALTAQVWKFLVETELSGAFISYERKKAAEQRAIDSIRTKIGDAVSLRRTEEAELRKLEKSTTSIQPTVNAINALLASFGFTNFSLSANPCGKLYKLTRADGSDAKENLSEGEKSFVTFLYFYHLVKGSGSESGMTNSRVVVFDDPVSSLDSDVLFIVSTLIKSLISEVRSGKGHIKQVFVLTHNIYFHKEVTYDNRRKTDSLHDETFWTIHKSDDLSKIKKHNGNPIRTSYDLLWSEVRRPEMSSHTLQNTMRRILENYFKILGGIDFEKICDLFEGREKSICKSLFSWVHDGSHSIHDELFLSPSGTQNETYLKVFRQIFKKSDHDSHYRMMMGADYVEEPLREETAATASLLEV